MNMQARIRYPAAFAGLAYLGLAALLSAQAQHSTLLPAPVKVQYGEGYLELKRL